MDDADAVWEFEAELWQPEGASWVFLTVPPDVDEDIRLLSGPRRGFGSVRVEATVGGTTWRTSVFPDARRGYSLPVKRDVRCTGSLEVGDRCGVRLRMI